MRDSRFTFYVSLMIGITLGDITGIGPEVTLKVLAGGEKSDETRYLLIGDAEHIHELNRRLALDLSILPYKRKEESGRIFVLNPLTQSLPCDLTAGSPLAAKAAVAWLREGAQLALKHEIGALVTAPVNKASIARAGVAFVGQTEFLSELAGARRTAMMLLGQDDRERWLRVVLVTTHLPLKSVSQHVTGEKVKLAIELAAQACRDLDLPSSRIGVCGLNPHAGEDGQMGSEEQTIIGPAVVEMQQKHIDVTGPMSADSLFYYAYRGDYDVVVAMYHDQGLGPLKMVAFEQGVNWTLGLPFIRTSPDHGTAYDITGKGKANPSSMRAAIDLAKKLAKRNAIH